MQEGFWKKIPGFFNYQSVYAQAVEEAEDGAVFVEIGVYLGRSLVYMAEKIAESGKDIKLIGIDQWMLTPNYKKLLQEQERKGRLNPWNELIRRSKHAGYPNMYLACKSYVEESGYASCIELVQSGSQVYSGAFAKSSLDFVFVDGDHSLAGCAGDIKSYWSKIKPGGVLAGHDYDKNFPGVVTAVDNYFRKLKDMMVEVVPPNTWRVRKHES